MPNGRLLKHCSGQPCSSFSAAATGATVFQSVSSLRRTKAPLWKGIESWCLDRILEELLRTTFYIFLLFQGHDCPRILDLVAIVENPV